MTEASLFRLYLLRGLYLLIAVGQGLIQWDSFQQTHSWSLMSGVAHSMLGALALVSLIGVRYPLQMLPLLFFEMAWKAIWLLAVAVPLGLAHQIDPDTMETIKACLLVVIVPVIIPWRYVFANYVMKAGDHWW